MKNQILILTVIFSLTCLNLKAQPVFEPIEIAPEFANFKGTLLILENRSFLDNAYNRMTEKQFKKNYTGKFEMITRDELISNEYKDTNSYRFVIHLTEDMKWNGKVYLDALSHFIMTDRATGKVYLDKVNRGIPATFMKRYAKKLEEVRVK